jgi:hypothetical protein
LSQVVCGNESFCSTALKEKLGTKEGIEFQMKCNDSYLIDVKKNLMSCQQKVHAARLIWIAHCINAARLGEVDLQHSISNQNYVFI